MWLKQLDNELLAIKNFMHDNKFTAEENIISSFLESLILVLKEVKIRCLEKEFGLSEQDSNDELDNLNSLSKREIAVLIYYLQNSQRKFQLFNDPEKLISFLPCSVIFRKKI